jgi:hypothetical protein
MERHRLDVTSLVAGVVLCGIALVALTDALVITIGDLRWLGPLALVALGVALVAGGGGRGAADEPDPDTPDGNANHDDHTTATEPHAADPRAVAHDDGVTDAQ